MINPRDTARGLIRSKPQTGRIDTDGWHDHRAMTCARCAHTADPSSTLAVSSDHLLGCHRRLGRLDHRVLDPNTSRNSLVERAPYLP